MIAAAVANHLWQSTLFALAAGVVAFLLRRNSAGARYGLWLAASVKFLIPFSVLVNLGASLAWPAAPAMTPRVSVAIEGIGRPFGQEVNQLAVSSNSHTPPPRASVVAAILAGVWFCGCLAVCLGRWSRLRRVRRIIGESVQLNAGREFDVLQRAVNAQGMRPLRILSSGTEMEPGVVGVFRQALLLPSDISGRLQDSELEAIFVHELSHVRRRDNLSAAAHAIVETIFWFHPLVWWIGNRLNQERERACDQETVASGCDPQVYAEGILRVCEFYVAAPRVFVAGVTGSNLKMRIEEIMTHERIRILSLGKKALLAAAGVAAVVAPVVVGLAHASISQAQSKVGTSIVTTSAAVLAVSPFTPQNPGGIPVRAASQPAQGPAASQIQSTSAPPDWPTEVSLIISDPERSAFRQLKTDVERARFIEDFWTLRDPTPGTAENEFRSEYYRRVAYADEHFKGPGDVPGSQTDRGKMFILLGAPDEIDSHPTGGIVFVSDDKALGNYRTQIEVLQAQLSQLESTLTPSNDKVQQVRAQIEEAKAALAKEQANPQRGAVHTFPFEMWRYRHINGKGDNVTYEFVDKSMNGNYSLEYDPAGKDR